MKRITIMITLFLMGTAIFSACSKDDRYDLTSSSGSASNSKVSSSTAAISAATLAQVTYSLTTQPMGSSSRLQWTGGYLNLTAIHFNAVLVTNARMLVDYPMQIGQSIKLFSNQAIGTVPVPPGLYDNVLYQLMLSSTTSSAAPFYLTGSFASTNGSTVPVQFTVAQPLAMSATFGSIRLQNDYVANLVLNLSQVTATLTDAMFDAAQITNGVMIISQTSNANLYQTMFNNLQKALVAPNPKTEPIPQPQATSADGLKSATQTAPVPIGFPIARPDPNPPVNFVPIAPTLAPTAIKVPSPSSSSPN